VIARRVLAVAVAAVAACAWVAAVWAGLNHVIDRSTTWGN
jgi:hypothetical protein